MNYCEAHHMEHKKKVGSVSRGQKSNPGGIHVKKSRGIRKPISCTECRRRKIKCHREKPCSSCIKRQIPHLCIYTHQKEPNGERQHQAQQRQKHALPYPTALSHQPTPSSSSTSSTYSRDFSRLEDPPSPQSSLEQEQSPSDLPPTPPDVQFDQGYDNGFHGYSSEPSPESLLSHEAFQQRNSPETPFTELQDPYPMLDLGNTGQFGDDPSGFGHNYPTPSHGSQFKLLPQGPLAHRIFRKYFKLQSVLPVLEETRTLAEIENIIRQPDDGLSFPAHLALTFSIMVLAIMAMGEDDPDAVELKRHTSTSSVPDMLALYVSSATQCLDAAESADTTSLTTLQASVLLSWSRLNQMAAVPKAEQSEIDGLIPVLKRSARLCNVIWQQSIAGIAADSLQIVRHCISAVFLMDMIQSNTFSRSLIVTESPAFDIACKQALQFRNDWPPMANGLLFSTLVELYDTVFTDAHLAATDEYPPRTVQDRVNRLTDIRPMWESLYVDGGSESSLHAGHDSIFFMNFNQVILNMVDVTGLERTATVSAAGAGALPMAALSEARLSASADTIARFNGFIRAHFSTYRWYALGIGLLQCYRAAKCIAMDIINGNLIGQDSATGPDGRSDKTQFHSAFASAIQSLSLVADSDKGKTRLARGCLDELVKLQHEVEKKVTAGLAGAAGFDTMGSKPPVSSASSSDLGASGGYNEMPITSSSSGPIPGGGRAPIANLLGQGQHQQQHPPELALKMESYLNSSGLNNTSTPPSFYCRASPVPNFLGSEPSTDFSASFVTNGLFDEAMVDNESWASHREWVSSSL